MPAPSTHRGSWGAARLPREPTTCPWRSMQTPWLRQLPRRCTPAGRRKPLRQLPAMPPPPNAPRGWAISPAAALSNCCPLCCLWHICNCVVGMALRMGMERCAWSYTCSCSAAVLELAAGSCSFCCSRARFAQRREGCHAVARQLHSMLSHPYGCCIACCWILYSLKSGSMLVRYCDSSCHTAAILCDPESVECNVHIISA